MADSITRCPKCRTSFRVNEAHLKTARGAVRCGSCLTIFNARENLIGSKKAPSAAAKPETKKESRPAAKAATAPKKPGKPAKAPAPPVDDDDILIDDNMDNSGDNDDMEHNVFLSKASQTGTDNLFERTDSSIKNALDDEETQDESWALNLLDEDEGNRSNPAGKAAEEKKPAAEPAAKAKTKAKSKAAPRVEPEFDSELEPETEEIIYSAQGYSSDIDADLFAKDSPFQIIEEEQPISNDPRDLFQERPAQRKTAFDEDFNEYLDEPEEAYYENKGSTQVYLKAFEAEPLELHVPYRRPLTELPLFWFGLSVLAGALAVFQISFFKFDEWSRDPVYRNYYASACSVFGCTLPGLADPSKISVRNIMVSEPSDKKGLLIVDAVLVNHASFDQPFPTLKMEFSDITGKALSTQKFLPKDYVGGELSGSDNIMPSKHPVHVTLEVSDPGDKAVNYQVSIDQKQ